MNRKVTLHPEAEEEILGALNWYAERSGLAARAFVQELSSVVLWLVARQRVGHEFLAMRGE